MANDVQNPRVNIYFDEAMQPVYRKMVRLNKKTGMSLSRIAYYAVQVGLPAVAENLEGLPLDFQAHAQAQERKQKRAASK